MTVTTVLRGVTNRNAERVSARPPLRNRLLGAIAAALGALLVLAEVTLLVLQAAAPRVEVTFRPAEMTSDGGRAVMARLDVSPTFPFRIWSDDQPGGSSDLVLSEDGQPLGPAHALHQDIRDLGAGRYSHYGAGIVRFSASDGSNPRSNGRRYAAAFREVVSPKLARALHIIAIVAAGPLLLLGAASLLRLAACSGADIAAAIGGALAQSRPLPRGRRAWISAATATDIAAAVGGALAQSRPFPRGRRAWVAAATALAALPMLAEAAFLVLQAAAPTVTVTFRPAEMASDGGFAMMDRLGVSPTFPFRLQSDNQPGDSNLVLREDGRPLGPAHVSHEEIRDLGAGRYSHYWGDVVRFSASDGSDPRSNGRRYTAIFREVVSPQFVRVVHGLDAAAGLLLLAAVASLSRLAESSRKQFAASGLSAVRGVARSLSWQGRWLTGSAAAALVVALLLSPALRHVAALLGGSIGMLFLASRIIAWSPGANVIRVPGSMAVPARIGLGVRAASVVGVALFVLFGPVQFYPTPGWADPSIYHGDFAHYSFNAGLGPLPYQAERLPFVLAGMALFHLLPVDWAYYAMALLPMTVLVLATLSIMDGMASPAVAISVLVLIASSSLVIAAIGQGYVSGFLIAAMMAGHASLLRSVAKDRISAASFMAGAWFALAAVSNPFALVLIQASVLATLPVFPAMVLRAPARIAWAGAGAMTIAILSCLFNKGLTGSFDFVSPSLNMATASGDTPFAVPLARWLPHALRLAYLAVVGGCGIVTILRCAPERAAQRRPAFLALCWGVAALMSAAGVLVVADAVLGSAFLTFWHYTCDLVPFTIVIMAATLALVLPDRGKAAELSAFLACAIGGACAIAGAIATRETDPASLHPIGSAVGVGVLSLGCSWLACRETTRRRKWRIAAAVLTAVAPVAMLDLNPDTRNAFVAGDSRARDAAIVSAEADRFIYAALDGRKPFFWYSASDYTRATAHPRGWEFPHDGLYPLWFHAPRLYNALDQIFFNYYSPSVPTLLDHEDTNDIGHSEPNWRPILRDPPRRKAIVVLSRDPEDGRRAAERAAKLFDADLDPEAYETLVRGDIKVSAWVFGLRDPGHIATESERFR